MLKSGNGDPLRCAENLMHIVQGEVAYDRVRGIDPDIIDKPTEEAALDLQEEADWNIETYEPRLEPGEVTIKADVSVDGEYTMEIQVSDAEGE